MPSTTRRLIPIRGMSTANYEWYDESTNPNFSDVDNEKRSQSGEDLLLRKNHLVTSHAGIKSYALGRMRALKYLTDYVYNYNYHIVAPGSRPL